MASFTCPFCGCSITVSSDNHREKKLNFHFESSHGYGSEAYLHIDIYRCPNEDCKKETLIARGVNGYIGNNTVHIYPQAIYKHFPNYVPAAIRQDYEEACLIRERSPKASATLARRCLQGMIRDYWGIAKDTLNDEISNLQGKVPPAQWAAINALRQMGNIGAHMEKDTNLIIDISTDEASKLIQLIELLVKEWYIARHDADSLYKEITDANSKLQDLRHP